MLKNNKKLSKTRILIVYNYCLFSEGLKLILENDNTVEIIGISTNPNDGIKEISIKKPDLIIIDVNFSGSVNGLDLVTAISKRYPAIKILAISEKPQEFFAERVIRSGGHGYLMKTENSHMLKKAIKVIMGGELYLNRKTTSMILKSIFNCKNAESTDPEKKLTNREFEVFGLIGSGYKSGEIAIQLNLSVKTIESHRNNISVKMGLRSTSELQKFAIESFKNKLY